MTDKTVTKTVRLPRDIAEFYDNKPIRAVLEEVYTLISGNQIRWNDGIEILKTGNVYTVESDLGKIEEVAKSNGMTLDEMFREIKELIESGDLKCQGGFMYVDVCPFDYTEFLGMCKRMHLPPQEAIDKMCQMMERE